MADPVTAAPEELTPDGRVTRPGRALELLRRPDFRRLFLAVSASELGDAFHYIALMWVALDAGGPLGVVAVRLADSVPALLFGLHGGVAADRWDRRKLMIAADIARAAVLVPVAAAGLAGSLPLWGLVAAAFLLESATSYFAPAYGAVLPSLVERRNVQQANAIVQATARALSVGGWAAAAGLLAVLPISAFFALNALSFVVSASLISRIHGPSPRAAAEGAPSLRAALEVLRPRRALAVGVAVLGVAVTVSAGVWIAGVPTLVRDSLGRGAGAFSLLMVGYAVGSIAGGIVLARRPVRRKALASVAAWTLYLPAYGLMAAGGSLWPTLLGATAAGLGQGSSVVLLQAAAQEDVPDGVLGRVMGLISLVHRGAHATGLLLVSPLFAFVDPRVVFAAAAAAIPAAALAGMAVASAGTPRPKPPPTHGVDRG